MRELVYITKIVEFIINIWEYKNKFRGAGYNFWNQVDTMTEDQITDFHLSICQLDFGDLTNIDVLKCALQYNVVPKKLTLRHFRHIITGKYFINFDIEKFILIIVKLIQNQTRKMVGLI